MVMHSIQACSQSTEVDVLGDLECTTLGLSTQGIVSMVPMVNTCRYKCGILHEKQVANGVVALFENIFGAKALQIYIQIKPRGSLGGTVVMEGTTLGLGILGILKVVSRVDTSAN